MMTISLLFVGLLSGILGAIMGLGGGIFLVPLLTLLYHLPIQVAVGTSLVGVIATSAGVAVLAPPGRGANVSLALRLEVTTTAGAIAGGIAAGFFHTRVLNIIFALVVFLTGGYVLFKSRARRKNEPGEALFSENYKISHWLEGLTGAGAAGLISGLLGIGGGFIKVPLMYSVMGIPLGIATATSNFMVGITAAASVFIYYGRGEIHPLVVVPTALGVFGGAMLGAYVLGRLRVSWVRMALVGLLFIMGAHMFMEGLRQ